MVIHAVKISDTKVELRPEGRIDSSNAGDVEKALLNTAEAYPEIVLKLTALDYISSAGLRALLALQKALVKKGGRLTLRGVSEGIREVFELTGFSNLLNIEV